MTERTGEDLNDLPGEAPVTVEVADNPERSRFELRDGDRLVGLASYVLVPGDVSRDEDAADRVVFFHTETIPSRQGNGLAEELVKVALDDQRPTGRTVVPACWFVADFIEANPEYRPLVER